MTHHVYPWYFEICDPPCMPLILWNLWLTLYTPHIVVFVTHSMPYPWNCDICDSPCAIPLKLWRLLLTLCHTPDIVAFVTHPVTLINISTHWVLVMQNSELSIYLWFSSLHPNSLSTLSILRLNKVSGPGRIFSISANVIYVKKLINLKLVLVN